MAEIITLNGDGKYDRKIVIGVNSANGETEIKASWTEDKKELFKILAEVVKVFGSDISSELKGKLVS